jgi:hypothetical protein
MKKVKTCSQCHQVAPLCYRIQYDASAVWMFCYPQCWHTLSDQNPYYIYGGTWKAKAR